MNTVLILDTVVFVAWAAGVWRPHHSGDVRSWRRRYLHADETSTSRCLLPPRAFRQKDDRYTISLLER